MLYIKLQEVTYVNMIVDVIVFFCVVKIMPSPSHIITLAVSHRTKICDLVLLLAHILKVRAQYPYPFQYFPQNY